MPSVLGVFRESDRQPDHQVQTFRGSEVSPGQFPEVRVQSDRLIHRYTANPDPRLILRDGGG